MTWPRSTRRVTQLCKRNGAEDDRSVFSFKLARHCVTHFWTASTSDTKGRPGKLGNGSLLQTHRRGWKGTNASQPIQAVKRSQSICELFCLYTTHSSSLKFFHSRPAFAYSFSFHEEWGEGVNWKKQFRTFPKTQEFSLTRPSRERGDYTFTYSVQILFCL